MIIKQPASLDKNQFLWSNYRPYLAWFIPILAAILYLNTVLNDFVLDDAIVLSKNEFVQKGISGIPDILSKDTFKGFFKKDETILFWHTGGQPALFADKYSQDVVK